MRARSLVWTGLLAAFFAMPASGQSADAGAPAAPKEATDEAAAPAATDDVSTEALHQLLAELRDRRRALDRRERDLAQRERVAEELDEEARRVLSEIEAVRDEVERRIAEWDEAAGARIARLAKVYAEMPPAVAAPLLEQLDLDLATAIVSKMKHKKSAAVMAFMSEDSALRVSNRAAQPLGPASAAPAKADKGKR